MAQDVDLLVKLHRDLMEHPSYAQCTERIKDVIYVKEDYGLDEEFIGCYCSFCDALEEFVFAGAETINHNRINQLRKCGLEVVIEYKGQNPYIYVKTDEGLLAIG